MFGEQDVNVDATEVLLTDLSKFRQYVVRVVAYNVNGPGPATDELTCRTFSDGNSRSFDFHSLFSRTDSSMLATAGRHGTSLLGYLRKRSQSFENPPSPMLTPALTLIVDFGDNRQ